MATMAIMICAAAIAQSDCTEASAIRVIEHASFATAAECQIVAAQLEARGDIEAFAASIDADGHGKVVCRESEGGPHGAGELY